MTGVFNDLLKRLNDAGGDHVHEGGVAKEKEEEEASSGKKLKDFMMKRRLYGRFRKQKDTENYSNKDMEGIFGKKKEKVLQLPRSITFAHPIAIIIVRDWCLSAEPKPAIHSEPISTV